MDTAITEELRFIGFRVLTIQKFSRSIRFYKARFFRIGTMLDAQ